MSTVKTNWNLRTYDVWGNAKDGYEVNDSYDAGEIDLTLTVKVNNRGTDLEFKSAYPSIRQIKRAFSLTGERVKLGLEGDDITIYVNRESDGYPIGKMSCVSHDSLSPIRKLAK